MEVIVHNTIQELATAVATHGATIIKNELSKHEQASIILATGNTQIPILEQLVKQDIPWDKITVFHLDEYVGIDDTHPASFKHYLQHRFVDAVPTLKKMVFVAQKQNEPLEAHVQYLNKTIAHERICLAFVGIGNNGHIAFNEPPADFHEKAPYRVITLTKESQQQQVDQGWFSSIDAVPTQAITMGIPQILKSQYILATATGAHKATMVQKICHGAVTPLIPASILQQHPHCTLYLDTAAHQE